MLLGPSLSVRKWALISSLVFATACGSDPGEAVPTGDDLDAIVNFVASEPLYVAAVERCLDQNGGGGSVWRSTYEMGAVPDQPSLLPETGLAEMALRALDQPEEPDTSSVVPRGLSEAVEMEGVSYPTGCFAYADKIVENDPLEARRRSLFDAYLEVVTIRVAADPRWIQTETDWSKCMAQAGYQDLARPGDVSAVISQRVSDAGNDRLALEELLLFDRSVSAASVECWEDLGISAVRGEVRADYEDPFVEEQGDLILAVAEGIAARKTATSTP